jgi:hypothetical protein
MDPRHTSVPVGFVQVRKDRPNVPILVDFHVPTILKGSGVGVGVLVGVVVPSSLQAAIRIPSPIRHNAFISGL